MQAEKEENAETCDGEEARSRGGRTRGKNRDAPDSHEGLRLRWLRLGNLAGFGEALKLQMRIMDISL